MNPLSDHQTPPPHPFVSTPKKENQVRPGRERRLVSHLDSNPALSWGPTLINNTARSVIHLHVINRQAWWLTEPMFIIQLRHISPFCTKVPRSIYGQRQMGELLWRSDPLPLSWSFIFWSSLFNDSPSADTLKSPDVRVFLFFSLFQND